jgi:predicted molibdopterin-dependent oxidoreductase YjgC
MKTILITIDGKELVGHAGQTIYEVAKAAGIHIPILCYHPAAKAAGACRVCVVEVTGARNLVASCAQPITDGMVVNTKSDRVISARRLATELLLSAGDHNCLVCEKNGDCLLQALAYELGITEPRFAIKPPGYGVEDGNPMIIRDMDKCVVCGRCVRACNEVQVNRVLDFSYRGKRATVGPAFGRSYEDSECVFCGECISVCPVGALTEKQGRFKGRAWEYEKVRTTCSYCGVGCQIVLNVKDGKVVKVTSDYDLGEPNQGSLCVKGRFGHDYIHHPDRLTKPLIKREGKFHEVSWDEALDYTAARLKEIRDNDGPDSIGVLTSARCTNEENYLLAKFARAVIGTNNVDHCARL